MQNKKKQHHNNLQQYFIFLLNILCSAFICWMSVKCSSFSIHISYVFVMSISYVAFRPIIFTEHNSYCMWWDWNLIIFYSDVVVPEYFQKLRMNYETCRDRESSCWKDVTKFSLTFVSQNRFRFSRQKTLIKFHMLFSFETVFDSLAKQPSLLNYLLLVVTCLFRF